METPCEKISDFCNHHRFTLRYLSKDPTTISLKLNDNIRTNRNKFLINKGERVLIIEHVRTINDTIGLCASQRHIYTEYLASVLDQGLTQNAKNT